MNIKTINLTGSEVAVNVGGYNSEIKNNGTDTIYASAASGVAAGADGVVSIPTGASVTVTDTRGTVYIIGTGSVEVVGKDFVAPVFKNAAAAGGVGENLLINPYFKVNQRGQTEYTSGYCMDCWKIITANTKVTMLPAGVKIGFNLDTSSAAVIGQIIEDYSSLAGKTVTASVFVAEKNAEKTMVSVNYLINGTRKYNTNPISAGINTFSVVLPDDIEDLQVWIYGADTRTGSDTSSSYTVVDWAKLELSENATRFIRPNYADELARCQRYYQLRSSGDIAAVDMRPSMAVIKDIRQREDGIYEYIAE